MDASTATAIWAGGRTQNLKAAGRTDYTEKICLTGAICGLVFTIDCSLMAVTKMTNKFLILFWLVLSSFVSLAMLPNVQTVPALTVLDKNNSPISKLTDGDTIRLRFQAGSAADQPTLIKFTADPDRVPIAECTIAKASDTCQTDLFPALGWAWSKNRELQKSRTLHAGNASIEIQIAPRPVVFAHGFGSDASAWSNYLGANGYLASIGVRGFAVGDDQAPGKLNLGNLANPTAPTGTIQSNAQTLHDYITAVKQTTGAQMVDLVAHSMGSLVSRYYVDREMPGRDVAQLILLGPPNRGTECAYLPSALGYYLPAVLEIRPSYVQNVFNRQITHRHGVPFTIIAGTPIADAIKSPCTAVPTDIAIAFASATGIPASVKQSDEWHSALNVSEKVFADLVKPLLQKSIGEFPNEPDPAPPTPAGDELQFTRVFTGHVAKGASATHTINIDNVAVASFGLFDPTRSLTVTVRGATGNLIQLDPTRNGLVTVQDPATLVYLGYGFNNPRPGPWQVTLLTTDATPNTGTDYAITAQLKGGAQLKAQATNLLPQVDETIQLSAQLELAGQSLPMRDVQARVRSPSGGTQTISLTSAGAEWKADWKPDTPGIFGIDVLANANAPDGTLIERSAFFTVEAQPTELQIQTSQLIFIAGVVLIIVVIAGGFFMRRLRRVRSA